MADLGGSQTNNNNSGTDSAQTETPNTGTEAQVNGDSSNNAVPTLADLLSLLDGTPSDSESTDDEGELSRPGVQGIRSLRVVLKGGGPWGFTLCGGADVRAALRIAEIEPGGKAELDGSLQVGDCLSSVNDVQCGTITEAVQLIQSAFRTLTLLVWRGNVEPTHNAPLKSPAYLRRAREVQVRKTPLEPQDDSIMYTESKHTLQSGAMKMKARQKPSRGESFCIGSVGQTSVRSARSPLSPHHSTRNYENLQSQAQAPVDGSTDRVSGGVSHTAGKSFSQRPYKHLSQEDLLERSRRLSESTDALPNSIGAHSGPLSPAKSTPALSQATMEDVLPSRYRSPSKPSFYSAKSSPNINQELDVSVLGEPPKLVRPSVYADKRLNKPGAKFPLWSAWQQEKDRRPVRKQSSPRNTYRPQSPSRNRDYQNIAGSPVNTYHPDTSFQPITEKENYRKKAQSLPRASDFNKHDYLNINYSDQYNPLSAGYEPSDSGTSDSELEEPPAIPPPPHPETLLNPALYPPCSPPAPPVRDAATIKFCKVNQSHEKYPSWPVTVPSIRGSTDPSQPITSRAESWSDHTNTSSEFPRKQRMAYAPFQPNLRPLTEKNSPLAERKTEDGKARNASDPGLKSDTMYHASVAKITDIQKNNVNEDRMKNFYNSQPGYPPPKYDSDGHNLGDKEYSVPSPPERDISVNKNELPPSNLASPIPKPYHGRYSSTDHSKQSHQSDHKISPLASPREESASHSSSRKVSSSTSTHGSSQTSTNDRTVDHYPPKRVDSRGYIVTPRPYYNTGTQTEVESSEQSNRRRDSESSKNNKRHADIQMSDMASQTSPKRPDSVGEQWTVGEEIASQTRNSWRSTDSDSSTSRLAGNDSQSRKKVDSGSRRVSTGTPDRRLVEEFRRDNRTRGRRSEGIVQNYQRDFQNSERIQDNRERIGSGESRDFEKGPPQNAHRKEEARETVRRDSRSKYDGAMNQMSPADRIRGGQENKRDQDSVIRDKHLVMKDITSDSDKQDNKRPASGRSASGRRSEPPLPLHKRGSETDVREDRSSRSDGSDASLPSFHEYTPSTAPLLRMLSKEMYSQHMTNRPQYQHDKSLSFSSQDNSSRSIGSPTPSSQYGNMKEAESCSSVLIYSDVSSGPFGRDDFGSQQSLGSQFSLLQEGKDYNVDQYGDKSPPSDIFNNEEPLSPRNIRKALLTKYSFDNTFHLMKRANQPVHRYTSSEIVPGTYGHNYVNMYDSESSQQQLSPRMRNSSQEPISPSSSDQRPSSLSREYDRLSGQSPEQGGNSPLQKSHIHTGSSSGDLSQSSWSGNRSKSSDDLLMNSPAAGKGDRQRSAQATLALDSPYKKNSSSGSSTDHSPSPSAGTEEQRQIDESRAIDYGKLTRNQTSSDLSSQSPLSQSEHSSSTASKEEQADSVFLEGGNSIIPNQPAAKPPQGRKRWGEKIVTRQESMKRAMGTFDEGERTLYTTTHLNKTSKSWNNLQDAMKDKVSKVPPRSQSYSNYHGLHSARSQSESNRLEQIQEASETPDIKTDTISRGSSQPNLSNRSHSDNERQAKEPKSYNPKMWEDDADVRKDAKSKVTNLKRATSEQIRSNKKRQQVQGEDSNVLTSKPPSNSADRRQASENASRPTDLDAKKSQQQALLNFVERKKGRSVGSSSSQTSSEGGSSLSSPKALSKWPSTSSETMVKRSESFSESTLSGGSDSRRHSTSSIQSHNREEKWPESPKETRKQEPHVKSSAVPASSYAHEERVTKAVRVEANTGALAPRPYKRPVPPVPFKSQQDEDAPPALPPRNYRKFDENPPATTSGNNLRRFSTEGRLDQTPQRRLAEESGKERFDSPREDAYVDRLRQEARRRLSEHVMPNPARINLINSKPARYISHSVATQPTVPQEATAIPLGQETTGSTSNLAPSSTTPTKPPSGPPGQLGTNTQQTKDSTFLTPLSIHEEGDIPIGETPTVALPESSPEMPLPSPPAPTPGHDEVDPDDLPPPPSFVTKCGLVQDDTSDTQNEAEELDSSRYPEGSYGSHKNNRSSARPFGSYQRSSSGPFNEEGEGDGAPKRLGERAWRSVQSLQLQGGTPSPDARSNRWLNSQGRSTAVTSPVNTLPRNPPQRRVSDNYHAPSPSLKSSTSFNASLTYMSARATSSRENLTNGELDTSSSSSSPSVRDRVSNFERSKYSERLNTSANSQSPVANSENNSNVTKTKTVYRSNEKLNNGVKNGETSSHVFPKEQNRIESPVSNSRIASAANLQQPSHNRSASQASTNSANHVNNNNKRISTDNSVPSTGRSAMTNSSKSSPKADSTVTNTARPETLTIVHRREKSREEEECDHHAKLLVDQINDTNLTQVISPPFEMKIAMDYMNGLFEPTSPTEQTTRSSSSSSGKQQQQQQASPKTTGKSAESNRSSSGGRKSESPLPANSPYWISSAKAKLIERMRETAPEEFKMGDEDGNIEQKKEELMERINQKLTVLQKARDDVQQDIDANNALGKQLSATVEEKCKGQNEKDKFKSYIGDLEKIVRLLLKLSGLLARAENALSCLPPDAEEQQRSALVDKRDRLVDQHEEAKKLKADIDRRRDVVGGILKNYLHEEEIGDYMHFVEMKSRLTIEFQELEDKITLGQEQLQALKRSMPDEM